MGINAIIKERHLLHHPFYQRWSQGKVPLEALREYARQYYHYECHLPGFLTSALEHITDQPARSAVAQVLEDESCNPKPHAEMWLDFAAGLGVEASDVKSCVPSPQTTNLVETYTSLCNRGRDEAVGALYAYETQQPEVAQAKSDGLIRFYGISDGPALAFFKLHSVLDVAHAGALRMALPDSGLARESAHLALDAWWGMLDQFE